MAAPHHFHCDVITLQCALWTTQIDFAVFIRHFTTEMNLNAAFALFSAICECSSNLTILCLKNAPNLASCTFRQAWTNFDKARFEKWCAYSTFLIPSLYSFYLLLFFCDGKDAKQRVFLGRLLVAPKRADCIGCWLWNVTVLVYHMFQVMSLCLRSCT